MDYAKEALRLHAKWNGKLETVPKMKIENKDDLSIAYTPGVAAPCLEIEKDKKKLHELENRKTNLDWEINSKKYSNEYAVNKVHDEKSKNSLKRNSRKKIIKSVFHRRSNMICHATVNDMSNAIQNAYYANLDIKQKVQEATRNAQREAYARQMY